MYASEGTRRGATGCRGLCVHIWMQPYEFLDEQRVRGRSSAALTFDSLMATQRDK